jgi:hypothetical protein
MPQQGVLFSADAIPLNGSMPIYDDILASVRSIQRLKAIEGIKVLLSAWDMPRFGEDAYRIMDQGIDYLQRIHFIRRLQKTFMTIKWFREISCLQSLYAFWLCY